MSNEKLVEQIRNGYHVTENMQMLYEKNLPLIHNRGRFVAGGVLRIVAGGAAL